MKEKITKSKGYRSTLIAKDTKPTKRIMIGIPMTGLLRSEWVMARYSQTIPCNWSQAEFVQWIDQYSPLNFVVADARNIIIKEFIEKKFEWLVFIDHDVILPPTFLIMLNERIINEEIPIFGGLYFTKSVPSEPLVYRGRGTGYFAKWKIGDKVWVDGMGLGCHAIHSSILKVLYEESEEYLIAGQKVRRVFETPQKIFIDPEKQSLKTETGTEDLAFYARIIRENILEKAGWGKFAKKRYPFLCDTNIFCFHIDWDGVKYPARGEQLRFVRKENVTIFKT